MLSLRARTIWSIIMTALLVAGIVAGYSLMEARKIIEKEAYAKLLNFAEKNASDFNQELDEVERNTRFVDGIVRSSFSWDRLKREKGYMERYKEELIPSIKTLAQQASISKTAYVFFRPELENKPNDVWFADLENTGTVKRQDQFPVNYYNGDRVRLEWYYHPMDTGKAGWTSVYQGTVEADKNVLYTSFTMPVKVDGKNVGVAGSDYFFDRMLKKVSAIQLYKTGYAFLVDQNGRVIIHPTIPRGTDLKTVYGGRFAPLVEMTKDAPRGVKEYQWIDGTTKLLVFVKLDNGWVFAAAPYKHEVYADADRIQKILYMMLALGFLFAAFMGYNLGTFLTEPVIHLTEITHAIGDGDYELKMEAKYLERTDEIGILAQSVENMRNRQQKSFVQIRQHANLLEARVAEKTEELRQTNEYLELSLAQLEEQHAELIETNVKLEDSYETIVNTQKRLVESEKIAALGYLVGGVAHEVNTPVGNGITLSTHMTEETRQIKAALEAQKVKKSELTAYFDNIESSSKLLFTNLNAIMEVISRFKELATEKTQISKIIFSPLEYMKLVIGGMHTHIEEKRVRIQLLCSDTIMLEGDPLKFSQILSNLLDNALLHAFEGMDSGLVWISLEIEGSDVLLNVSDNGSGIAESDINNIFVPFFSTKFNNKNKGLGLSVVYNIVHKVYDGEITVNSDKGEGTEVVVRMRNIRIVEL